HSHVLVPHSDSLLLPLLQRAERLTGAATLARDGPHDPDQDADAHGEHRRTPKPEAGYATPANREGNPEQSRWRKEGGHQHTQPHDQRLAKLELRMVIQNLGRPTQTVVDHELDASQHTGEGEIHKVKESDEIHVDFSF